MKTIGLIGGMSWESTAHYYALLHKLGWQAVASVGGRYGERHHFAVRRRYVSYPIVRAAPDLAPSDDHVASIGEPPLRDVGRVAVARTPDAQPAAGHP